MSPNRFARSCAVLAASAICCCAHEGASASASSPPTQEPPAAVVTGSHVPQRVDTSSGLPRTTSPVEIWTQEQLQATGEAGLGDQLRKLTP